MFSSFPDRETARQIGTMLVEKQLAACVTLLPGAESVYRWQGRVESAGEVFCVIKTVSERVAGLREVFSELHPYEVPEFIVVCPADVGEAYAAWIRRSTGQREGGG